MSTSSAQFTTMRSKIASAFGKLAPKSRKQNSKASAPKPEAEHEFKSATSDVDVNSIIGYPMTSTLRVFNSQRSNKVPFREPAGFPVNHNFSQRVIYEFAHDEDDEAIFLTPYMRSSQVLPAIPLSPRDTKEGPLIGFSTWREPKKVVEVTKYRMEKMMLESQADLPHAECPLLPSPTRDASIQAEAWSPRTPYKSSDQISSLITPGLSSSSKTPSTVGNNPTPLDSSNKASKEETYFTRPTSQSFIPFPTTPSPMPPFSRQMRYDPFLPNQTVPSSSSHNGRRTEGFRPLGSEMMDTLDFLSKLCKRPDLLAGDEESLLDEESVDDDVLMPPFYHAR
ncbi:hypothetical protein DFH28DRAFT_472318 [Melampsora americana]|nr:hypothetical protein DFH28DRAFT_472318 [Melampsora americana]